MRLILQGTKKHMFFFMNHQKVFRVALFKVIIELTFLNLMLFCECNKGFNRNNPLSEF